MSGIRAFFRVLSYAPRSEQRNFLLAQLGVVVMVGIQLMIPQLVQQIIDDGILAEDTDRVVDVGFQMILWSMLNLIVAGGVAYLTARTATNLAHALRRLLYEKVTTFSHGDLDRLSTAELLVRLTSDVNIMKTAFMQTMFMLFQAPWLLIGAVVLVWWQSPSLVWIMAAVMVVTVVVVLAIAPALGPLYARAQAALDRLNTVFYENIAGIRVVKAFNRTELEADRFSDRNHEVYQRQLAPALRSALFQPVLFGLLYSAVGLAVLTSGVDVAGGVLAGDPDALQPGELTTFFNYLLTAMIPIMIVAFVLPELGRFEASLARIVEVMQTEPDIVEQADPIDPGRLTGRIEFRSVTMAYLDAEREPLPTPVLRDVSFEVEPGETVAVLGQTGSGKTTLISLVPRFYDTVQGQVLVDGHDVRTLDLAALRSQISVAEQQARVFAGTFYSNIAYGRAYGSDAAVEPRCDYHQAEHAATVADAHGFISAQLDGYDGAVTESGNNLSGGQRQRLSLARAIAARPQILILDDTTSAVDVATEARIQQALDVEMAGRTVLIVAQRITTAMRADKIVLLDEGTVSDVGTHAELLDRSDLYREIAESQLGSLEEIAELLERS
ncbi:MAG: ABC transporter ATP-binding protein [Actinomycetota bacterium]